MNLKIPLTPVHFSQKPLSQPYLNRWEGIALQGRHHTELSGTRYPVHHPAIQRDSFLLTVPPIPTTTTTTTTATTTTATTATTTTTSQNF